MPGGWRASLKRQSTQRRSLTNAADAAGKRTASRRSFPHRDFANPDAETCWLSCLFQALWHSPVFHAIFDEHLVLDKYTPAEDEDVLAALQLTWEDYRVDAVGAAAAPAASTSAPAAGAIYTSAALADADARLVPADDLAVAFGQGYGDLSEAFATIREELSRSACLAAIGLAEQMVLVPLPPLAEEMPSPLLAWRQVEEWQAGAAPLIAVDLGMPAPTREECVRCATNWLPRPSGPSPSCADLGPQHRLVAMVCFMWDLQHYVTFCRRQSDETLCLFFNDLPDLTRGVARENAWDEVPELCGRFLMSPRLLLYERPSAEQ